MSENRTRFRLDQRRAPIYEALERFRQMRVVPFDVPATSGAGATGADRLFGPAVRGRGRKQHEAAGQPLPPGVGHPGSRRTGRRRLWRGPAFLMVGGTTSSVQSMVLTACKRGDEIILPRNVHRSVLNALVLCGAVPVYVNPEVDKRLASRWA